MLKRTGLNVLVDLGCDGYLVVIDLNPQATHQHSVDSRQVVPKCLPESANDHGRRIISIVFSGG